MSTPLIKHFAINADDPERARAFYESTFGWSFEAWGPPGFYRAVDDGPVIGVVQKRRPLVEQPTQGFECTIGVEDLSATVDAAVAAGGRIVMEPTVIEGVGELVFVEDTEGHVVGVMKYER